jgi:hypothetical protein
MSPLSPRDLEDLYMAVMRAPLVLIVALGLWGVVLEVLARLRVDLLSTLLDGPKRADKVKVTADYLIMVSGGLMVLMLVCVYGADAAHASPSVGMGFFALLSGVTLLLPALAPLRECAGHFLYTIELVLFPGSDIRFPEVLAADMLTSLSRVFADAGFASLLILRVWTSADVHSSALLRAMTLALLASFPQALRARQCLIQARGEPPGRSRSLHYSNMGKYLSAFPLVWLSACVPIAPPGVPIRALTAVAAVVNTLYSLLWDVKMDWGLLQDGGLLRPRLLLGNSCPYISAILMDSVLRSFWAVRWLPLPLLDRMDITMVLELVEVCRRCMWSIFRLEWEYIKTAENESVLPMMSSSSSSSGVSPNGSTKGGSSAFKTAPSPGTASSTPSALAVDRFDHTRTPINSRRPLMRSQATS